MNNCLAVRIVKDSLIYRTTIALEEIELALIFMQGHQKPSLSLLSRSAAEPQCPLFPFPLEGLYCNRTWDGWLCWNDVAAGTESMQYCPDYFQDFDPSGGCWNLIAHLIEICLVNIVFIKCIWSLSQKQFQKDLQSITIMILAFYF